MMESAMKLEEISQAISEDARWRFRPPPRGLIGEEYQLCPDMIVSSGLCLLGDQCSLAHSAEELEEWRLRFSEKASCRMLATAGPVGVATLPPTGDLRINHSRVQPDGGGLDEQQPPAPSFSFGEKLFRKWMESRNPESVMSESAAGVECVVDGDVNVTMSSKVGSNEWTFSVTTERGRRLRRVCLVQDWHRDHFNISSVVVIDPPVTVRSRDHLDDECQEWTDRLVEEAETDNDPRLGVDPQVGFDPGGEERACASPCNRYLVTVKFRTEIYGTFRQTVCFDFGEFPILVRRLCVDSLSMTDLDKLMQLREDVLGLGKKQARWTVETHDIVEYHPRPIPVNVDDKGLLQHYPAPNPLKVNVSNCAASYDERSTMENNENGSFCKRLRPGFNPEYLFRREVYVPRMHELLAIEEMAQFSVISRYNVRVTLELAEKFLLLPGGFSSAKHAPQGMLFAKMNLQDSCLDLSEDTAAGRLILTNVNTALLQPFDLTQESNEARTKVYEVLVEEKGKNFVYLTLSSQCVTELNLAPDTQFDALIQFQLNRLPLCEMHHALDKIASLTQVLDSNNSVGSSINLIFSKNINECFVPWTPSRQWNNFADSRLNAKQREAIVAITTNLKHPLPPILVIGPFGTGKTFTLAQAAKKVLEQDPNNRILICTHSNSAADLYIREYFHPYVEEGHVEATPLRLYYENRWVETVHPYVLKYCSISKRNDELRRTFAIPSLEQIMMHRVIVATLGTAKYLSQSRFEDPNQPYQGIPNGFFTHIFLDEAAQALAPEALQALTFAGPNTRIVLAGDHMQLSPELHSKFALEQGLGMSLLEQLFRLYPQKCPAKILLCENYRSNQEIVSFTSKLFYQGELIPAIGKQQKAHPLIFPLTFYTARGEDVHHENSLGFYNIAEVYEVVDRIAQIQECWPVDVWGPFASESIGVVTPYADQVWRIRSELRKRRMFDVSVERVLNVQGKQFRVIFLSTVRTRHTVKNVVDKEKSVTIEFQIDDLESEESDYGFLSNPKLLTTAITRAQSLVAVVGDPVALCSVGQCRKIWEKFIETCRDAGSLIGMSFENLKEHLDALEMKKFKLNPLAPEFVPARFRNPPPVYPFVCNSYNPYLRYPMYVPNFWPIQNEIPSVPPFYPQQLVPQPPCMAPLYPNLGASVMYQPRTSNLPFLPNAFSPYLPNSMGPLWATPPGRYPSVFPTVFPANTLVNSLSYPNWLCHSSNYQGQKETGIPVEQRVQIDDTQKELAICSDTPKVNELQAILENERVSKQKNIPSLMELHPKPFVNQQNLGNEPHVLQKVVPSVSHRIPALNITNTTETNNVIPVGDKSRYPNHSFVANSRSISNYCNSESSNDSGNVEEISGKSMDMNLFNHTLSNMTLHENNSSFVMNVKEGENQRFMAQPPPPAPNPNHRVQQQKVQTVPASEEDLLMEASKLLMRLFPSMPIEDLHRFIMSQVHANVSAVSLLTQLLQLQYNEQERECAPSQNNATRDSSINQLVDKIRECQIQRPQNHDRNHFDGAKPKQTDIPFNHESINFNHESMNRVSNDFPLKSYPQNGGEDYLQNRSLSDYSENTSKKMFPFENSRSLVTSPYLGSASLQSHDSGYVESNNSASPDAIALLQSLQIGSTKYTESYGQKWCDR